MNNNIIQNIIFKIILFESVILILPIAAICTQGLTFVVVNLFFNLVLVFVFDMAQVGMAAATTIAGWVNVGVMGYVLHQRGIFVADALLKSRLVMLTIASGIMAIALMLTASMFTAMYADGTAMKVVALSSSIGIGMAVYAVAVLVLKAYDASVMVKLVRRKP